VGVEVLEIHFMFWERKQKNNRGIYRWTL